MVSQRKDKTSYSVIGVMAGSSMDGLDLAYVRFEQKENAWIYSLEKCRTETYPAELFDRLKQSASQTKENLLQLDADFGSWIAGCINKFNEGLPEIDLLGVHGHTVIHDPSRKISWQLGNGAVIAKETKICTVSDFRTLDVESGGQGAPLVPFGDYSLFAQYDACLNLGGIANISIKESKTAWDICPCNQVLNHFAEKKGLTYDSEGSIAKKGSLDSNFYNTISALTYFDQAPPKSLPNNFIGSDLLDTVGPENGLHTYCRVIADQIRLSLDNVEGSKLLITGGGGFNTYLVSLIKDNLKDWDVHIPGPELVSYKESLVFAFLALKRLRNEINTLSSVTGAIKDTSSGVIHLP